MTADYALPPPDEWAGRKIAPDNYDKKANWPSHLAEIVHAYNATQSTVTGYSPLYLMFGQWPRLLVNFVFPTVGSNEAPTREASTRSVDIM